MISSNGSPLSSSTASSVGSKRTRLLDMELWNYWNYWNHTITHSQNTWLEVEGTNSKPFG